MAAANAPRGKPAPTSAGNRARPGQIPSRPKSYDNSIEGNLKQLLDDQEFAALSKSVFTEETDTNSVDAPLVRLVNSLMIAAVKQGASDVHIEPFESLLRVRFRIDGVLQEIHKIPHKLGPAITSRLKIMADLDICERRIPQDGTINFKGEDVEADFRLSTLPSSYGEKIVMRVMGRTNVMNDLSKLGISAEQLTIVRDAINRPDGLVLVTGPTGSGKTTTLYAALNELNDISVSVFTAEDPVEGDIPGVTQCQVNASVGYTFASMLRSFLRQDPDVILVGEIRDQETAEISIKAALTGHLVLSTLHTNCAVSSISRLLNMGIAPYLITSSVSCVVAQRLVRKICENCRQECPIPPEVLEKLGAGAKMLANAKVCRGTGCKECHNSGYRGRAPLYEVLSLSDTFRRLVLAGSSLDELKWAARKDGMITLRQAGLALVRDGITTLEEVLSATNEDSSAPPQSNLAQANLAQANIAPSTYVQPTLAPAMPAQAAPILNQSHAPVTPAHPAQQPMAAPTAAPIKPPASVAAAEARIVTPVAIQNTEGSSQSRWKSLRPSIGR